MDTYNHIFGLQENTFEATAIETFHHQARSCEVYREYLQHLQLRPEEITQLKDVPFLPIQFFKTHQVINGLVSVEKTFESSGTSGTINSKHYIHDVRLYHQSVTLGFNAAYGNPNQYSILGLLPSYLERGNSSLVEMTRLLMSQSGHPINGFFLDEFEHLHRALVELEAKNQPTILIGVTFALLDFAEQFPTSLKNTVVMETGGMKGRRQEMTRSELHSILKAGFGVEQIHSEYGMTELLSQAYSKGEGKYDCPSWMKVLIRDVDDPFNWAQTGYRGGVNIIDLANQNSCAFIATDDIGLIHDDGSFEILGRFDGSETRGCSLLAV